MKLILKILGGLALALTFIPACLNYNGSISDDLLKQLMLAGTFLWFAAAIPAHRSD